MSSGLFRAQVRDHAQSAWLGTIVLIQPASFAFLAACAFAIAVAMGAFLVLGEYTRKARLEGIVAPQQGVVRILAPQPGIVESVRVAEGDEVARDALVATLADARESAAREADGSAVAERLLERGRALARQRASTAQAASSEQAAATERVHGLEREREALDREMETQSTRVELASRGMDRARELEAIGFLSIASADRERDAGMQAVAQLEGLRRARIALSRDLAAARLDQQAARARSSAQLAALDLQRASVEQERLEHELQYRAAIVAPASGTVAAILVERDQAVVAGTALATLIPARSPLEVHLFAPSRSIGFVHAGQEVLVRFLAYPHQKFGAYRARVVAVSRAPLPAGEPGFVPADGGREPLYRIKAALASQAVLAYGKPRALKAGMQVEADVLLDRRRLIEWIFEPLLGLAGRT